MSKHPEADLLSSVLSACPLHAGVDGQPRFCGHWLHGTAGMRRDAFHPIGEAQRWLHLQQPSEPTPLAAGDRVVPPHDSSHRLSAMLQARGRKTSCPPSRMAYTRS